MRNNEGSPLLEMAQGIATVHLRRPSQRNSLCDADLKALLDIFERVDVDTSIRALVLTADTAEQRRPIFCAGYNVGEFESRDHDRRLFEKVANALESLRPISICALSGSVYGGATDLVLACDLRIALAGCEFRMPACALGLHYYPSGLRRFISHLGLSGAKRAFLTGKALSVEQLQQFGIFEQVTDITTFETSVSALARKVADLAPIATQLTKRSLSEIASGKFDLERLGEREALSLDSADFLEGRMAMLEKRRPLFSNR